MSFQRFDRHEEMSSETREEILDIITNTDFRLPSQIKNSLYGLFDGFLYSDLLTQVKEKVDNSFISFRIKNVINEVKEYKTLTNE